MRTLGEYEIDPACRPYKPQGAALKLFYDRSPEILMVGAAGTGKSRGALEKVHLCLCKNAGSRGLLVRKTRESMTQSTLVTFETKVLPEGFLVDGPSRNQRQSYQYPNGSELVVGGMDKPSKVLSTEFDILLVDEATEISENDWETLLSRLRNHRMPYQQAIACCNPDAPTHWLRQRADRGLMVELVSRHADNPTVTAGYLSMLDRLTGVRRLRLRDGVWAAAEGRVYDEFDRSVHLIHWDCTPGDFTRLFASVDWGYTHAGVIQVWGEDHDGRLYLVREVFRTQRTIDWWVEQARRLQSGLGVEVFVCDPARPDHMDQFEREGLPVLPAYKSVQVGINAVKQRLAMAGDGKARLYLLDDALAERDELLVEAKRPWSTAQEIDSYVWNAKKDEPVKECDDGMDAMRYAVAYADKLEGGGVELVN
jgi:PBSX family phage terminase large subunit